MMNPTVWMRTLLQLLNMVYLQTAGPGVGIDRLVMFLFNRLCPSIRDALLFPLMKPEAPKHVEAEEEAAE